MAIAVGELEEFAAGAFSDQLTQWLVVLIVLALVGVVIIQMNAPPVVAAAAWPRVVYSALDEGIYQ